VARYQVDVFTSPAAVELERFENIIANLQAGSVTITGGPDEFVPKLCSYLSTLSQGDQYWTVTIPDFWTADNLGVQARYLSMNAEIVRRGAIVERVFARPCQRADQRQVREVRAGDREHGDDRAKQKEYAAPRAADQRIGQAVTDHRDGRAGRPIIVCGEPTAKRRRFAQHVEQRATRLRHDDLRGRAARAASAGRR
jgi:hypothetical protein